MKFGNAFGKLGSLQSVHMRGAASQRRGAMVREPRCPLREVLAVAKRCDSGTHIRAVCAFVWHADGVTSSMNCGHTCFGQCEQVEGERGMPLTA